jgi:hypothetical protein
MEAKAIKLFRDKKEGVIRKAGDTFILTKERFDEINSTQYGILVETAEAVKPKKKTKK